MNKNHTTVGRTEQPKDSTAIPDYNNTIKSPTRVPDGGRTWANILRKMWELNFICPSKTSNYAKFFALTFTLIMLGQISGFTQTINTTDTNGPGCTICNPTGWGPCLPNPVNSFDTPDISDQNAYGGGGFPSNDWRDPMTNPPTGHDYFINASATETSGTTITGLTSGVTYELTFYFAENVTVGHTNAGSNYDGTFAVYDGPIYSGQNLLFSAPMPVGSTAWTEGVLTFTATGTTQNICVGYTESTTQSVAHYWLFSVDPSGLKVFCDENDATADCDNDGVLNGVDCDPADASVTTAIGDACDAGTGAGSGTLDASCNCVPNGPIDYCGGLGDGVKIFHNFNDGSGQAALYASTLTTPFGWSLVSGENSIGGTNMESATSGFAVDNGTFYHLFDDGVGTPAIYSSTDPIISGWTLVTDESGIGGGAQSGFAVDNGTFYHLFDDGAGTPALYSSTNPASSWTLVTDESGISGGVQSGLSVEAGVFYHLFDDGVGTPALYSSTDPASGWSLYNADSGIGTGFTAGLAFGNCIVCDPNDANADCDNDGVLNGVDCDPADAAVTTAVGDACDAGTGAGSGTLDASCNCVANPTGCNLLAPTLSGN